MRIGVFITVCSLSLGVTGFSGIGLPSWAQAPPTLNPPPPETAPAPAPITPSVPGLPPRPEQMPEFPPGMHPHGWGSAQWAAALGLLVGAIALAAAAKQERQEQRLRSLRLVQTTMQAFEDDPDISNVLNIIDFEEYRDFHVSLPGFEQPISFRPTDERLCAALMTHDERAKLQKKVDKTPQAQTDAADMPHHDVLNHHIETVIRDWFNRFFLKLSHFEHLITSGLISQEDLKPWIIRWLKLLADRKVKRRGGSKFYDQLYTYIHVAGYTDVEKLFNRYGYRIIPSPYREDDIRRLQTKSITQGYSNLLALSLAKAAYLVYEDLSFVAEVMQRWGIDMRNQFRYFNAKERDTQAFIVRTPSFILLVFRGSQEIKDWQTNFSTKLRKYALQTELKPLKEDVTPPVGQVHAGFEAAWVSVQNSVMQQILQWNQEGSQDLPIYVTGHSLGGALATVASASLLKLGFNVQALYTFGQPRVGDVIFATEIGGLMKGKAFRFVNNNDVVPHVPPPWLPWNFFRVYMHLGQMRYFDAFGKLVLTPSPILRTADFVLGLIRSLAEPGFDLVADHRMELYVANLQEVVAVELERQQLLSGTKAEL